MGWKNFKERFGIDHIVQVTDKGVCIGSGYVHDLVTINLSTGKVSANPTFSNFLNEFYPSLIEVSANEIQNILNTPDVFLSSIPVFTYEGGEIIEKSCEKTGWPNLTHDGCLMYENQFSTDKLKVVQWAKRNAQLGVKFGHKAVADAENELASRNAMLAKEKADLARLDRDYPDVVVEAV